MIRSREERYINNLQYLHNVIDELPSPGPEIVGSGVGDCQIHHLFMK